MKITKLVFIFFSLICLSAVSFAQTPVGTPPPLVVEDDEVLKIESRLVMVPVSVTDSGGRPVKGLGVENFLVRENKRMQEVAEVSAAEKIPLEIALLFDVSASTDPMFEFEQDTAARFLQQVMRPQDRATIFTIGERPVLVQNRNVSFRSVETIRSLRPTRQQTAFYDSVKTAAEYLQKNAAPKSRRVVIVISDGEDTNSYGVIRAIWNAERKIVDNNLSRKELRKLRVRARDSAKVREQLKVSKALQDADTVFYSINPAGSSYQLNKMSQFGQENMQKFATETGGTAFLPKFLPIDLKSQFESAANKQKNIRMLEDIFRRLSNELQAQYLVQYYSNGEYPANKFVDLDVKVNLNMPGGLMIRSRRGYFVKQ